MMETPRWRWIDGQGVRWLREHPGEIVRLDRCWLPYLLKALDLRVAEPLARTKLGQHLEEYRESRKWYSIHLREFETHLEIHADKLNPDWDVLSFVGHFFADVLGVG